MLGCTSVAVKQSYSMLIMRTSHRAKKISWPGLEIENFIDFLQVFKQVFLADVDISYPELFMNRS